MFAFSCKDSCCVIMYAQVLFTFHQYFSHPITIILILSLIIPTHNALSNSEMYNNCSETITSACDKPIGGIIEYPFWGDDILRPSYCGLEEFKLSCEDGHPVVDIGSDSKYRVLEINQLTNVLTLEGFVSMMDICGSSQIKSIVLNKDLYDYAQNTEDLHFYYNCDATANTTGIQSKFTCPRDDDKQVYFFGKDTWSADLESKLGSCHHTSLPVNTTVVLEEFIKNVENAIMQRQPFNVSFEVQYNKTYGKACLDCVKTGGLCWQDTNIINNNTCLYWDGTVHSPYPGKSKKLGLKIGIASGVVVGSMLLLLVLFVLFRRKKNKRGSSVVSRNVSRNVSSYSFSMSDSEKGSDPYMGVATFSYNELEKATSNFDSSNELGDGGFGTVYKGKLQDGREVAVKRLYENNYKRVEQFMNEIVILTKLRHPNLVVLYGSTSSQCRKLLLVYEYIPNGTIADHLYGDDAEPGNLAWKTRMSIAVETASALSYLHKTEVIHRDVKTTNILLDNNFHVKVADFGLSRLFPMNVTHVSTAPQGTPGYVDPEYHQCYQLTVKSDVYSFGVVLIELISSKPAVDITRHRHEINLANLAINKIQGNALDELVDPSLGFESDYNIKNMITEVAELAFRCLQNERESRPSMEEVYKSLKETQSKYYGEKNESDDNLLGDDAFLLKNYPQNLSPDSVTAKWFSKSNNSSSSI